MSQAASPDPTPHHAETAHACGKDAVAALNVGDLAAAEAGFRAAIAADPTIAGLHSGLARCFDRQQRTDEAIRALEEAARLDPGEPTYPASIGEICMRADRFAEAEAALRRSLALRDGELGVLHRLSIAIERQGRHADALAFVERVSALNPTNPDYHVRIAAIAGMAGDRERMERGYRAALALRPTDLALHRALIGALDRPEREDDLIEALNAAMQAGPDDTGLAEQLGIIMMKRDRFAEADTAFRKVTAANPQSFGIFHRHGIVLERLGKIDEAIEAAARASALAPGDPNLMQRVATLSLSGDDNARAEQALRGVIAMRPGEARLHHMLGVALDCQDRFAEALDEARTARELEPGNRGLRGRVVALESILARGRPGAEKTYLIFAANGVGLGHLMAAVLANAYYAWRTGRVFCMDMREVIFFSDDAHSAFFEHFRLVVPDGLEVITDLAAIEAIKQEPDLFYLPLTTPLDVEQPFPNKVVMVPCIAPGEPFRSAQRRADRPFRIELKGRLADALARSTARPEWQRHLIGVHYRATVGELFDRMTELNVPDYKERYAAVKDNYVARAMNLVEGRDPGSYAIFVASDDRTFVAEMLERLPNAFAFDTLRLDREFMAYVIANKHDITILVDAVTDLWALSQCRQLVYSRSAFTNFAIMNSAHLDAGNTFYIHMPMFQEILDSVPADTAVDWAHAAVRKIEVSRMMYEKSHQALVRALRRAGREEEAALYAKRAAWLYDASHAPEIANPAIFAARAQLSRGVVDLAEQRIRHAIEQMPGNPYLRGGFGGSLSTLLRRRGDLEGALVAAREAVALDPLDAFLHDHLGALLAFGGDFGAAEPCFRKAVALAPDVAVFHANLAACAARRGDIQEAAALAERAMELDPEDERYRARRDDPVLAQGVILLAA